jgi:hypothetical protein
MGHTERMVEKRSICRVLVQKQDAGHINDLGVDGKIIYIYIIS